MFTFKFTLADEDFAQHTQNFYKEKNKGKISVLIFGLFIMALGIAVMCDMLFFTAAPGEFQILLLMAGVMLVFFGVRYLMSTKSIIKRTYSEMSKYRQRGALISDEETELVFCEDKITRTSLNRQSTFTYSTVCGIKTEDGAVYVNVDPMIILIVPARAFESDEQREEFVKFIEKKIEENKV